MDETEFENDCRIRLRGPTAAFSGQSRSLSAQLPAKVAASAAK